MNPFLVVSSAGQRRRLLLGWAALGIPGTALAVGDDCANALSPVQEGWTWTYRAAPSDSKQAPITYSASKKLTASGYSVSYQWGKSVDAVAFKCEQGNQTSLRVPDFDGATITRAAVSGPTFAAESVWKSGVMWATVWALEGRRGLLSGAGTLTTTWQIVGREKVTVPAGTFNAWKVRIKGKLAGKLGPVPLSRDLGESSEWYAEAVGLVKSQSMSGVTELLSLNKGP